MDEIPNKSKSSLEAGVRQNPKTPSGGEDEYQEDEPSSSLQLSLTSVNAEPTTSSCQELDNFRLQWRKELEMFTPKDGDKSDSVINEMSTANERALKSNNSNDNINELDTKDNVFQQAKALYLNGVCEERSGRLYEGALSYNLFFRAISFYRRAIQLVPDIEYQLANGLDYSEQNSSVGDLSSRGSVNEDDISLSSDTEESTEIQDLVSHIEKIINRTGNFRCCKPAKPQNGTHLSELPHEVFVYILKWVVSNDLDCHSLEESSRVCRGFYLSARDASIWRLACIRVWGVNCGLPNKYGSWRNMFVYRPHPWFHGAYISKTSYVRYGESSFQDSNYRPVYIVDYFRYLRFFPEGVVLMLTTPDDPYQSLSKLKKSHSRHPTVMSGHYRLVGSTILVVLKRPKASNLDCLGSSSVGFSRFKRQPLRPKMGQDSGEESFHIELEIQDVKKRPNFKLAWKHYSLHRLFRNCQESISEIDINPTNFPPFHFSRVKSFNLNAEYPLQ